MAYPDAFALGKSALNPFLLADVGEEPNGSPLTVLSLLARRGVDPWIQAAQWSSVSPDEAIGELARAIAGMPLVPSALADAHATAARLILMLPASTKPPGSKGGPKPGGTQFHGSVSITAFFCALGFALALITFSLKPAASPVTTASFAAPLHGDRAPR